MSSRKSGCRPGPSASVHDFIYFRAKSASQFPRIHSALTIHSSRHRFAARLNSGVRSLPPGVQAKSFQAAIQPTSGRRQQRQGLLPIVSSALQGHSSGIAQTRYPSAVVGVDRKQHRPALHSGRQSLSAVKSIVGQRPNNSFKPRPLRGLGKVP